VILFRRPEVQTVLEPFVLLNVYEWEALVVEVMERVASRSVIHKEGVSCQIPVSLIEPDTFTPRESLKVCPESLVLYKVLLHVAVQLGG
jgi:hypothetical protein